MILKNIFIYYLLIVLPLLVLAFGIKSEWISSVTFAIGLLVYALVYHPLISGMRLIALGKIKPSMLGYNFIPFWNGKYFASLFLGK
jgi:hypothetical protein